MKNFALRACADATNNPFRSRAQHACARFRSSKSAEHANKRARAPRTRPLKYAHIARERLRTRSRVFGMRFASQRGGCRDLSPRCCRAHTHTQHPGAPSFDSPPAQVNANPTNQCGLCAHYIRSQTLQQCRQRVLPRVRHMRVRAFMSPNIIYCLCRLSCVSRWHPLATTHTGVLSRHSMRIELIVFVLGFSY